MPQRWLVVFSPQAYAREVAPFRQQLRRQQAHAQKQLWHLRQREFATAEGARGAVAAWEKAWRFHRAQGPLEPVGPYGRRGRPRAGEAAQQLRWRGVGDVVEEPAAVAAALQSTGKVIVATTAAQTERRPAETMLAAYQAPGVSVARGVRCLQAPRFCADRLFLQRPARLRAVLLGMGVARLVEALAEHTVRTALVRRGEALPTQRGQPPPPPTMRRLFPRVEGIAVRRLPPPHDVQRLVVNLQPMPHQILTLLGLEGQKCDRLAA